MYEPVLIAMVESRKIVTVERENSYKLSGIDRSKGQSKNCKEYMERVSDDYERKGELWHSLFFKLHARI